MAKAAEIDSIVVSPKPFFQKQIERAVEQFLVAAGNLQVGITGPPEFAGAAALGYYDENQPVRRTIRRAVRRQHGSR
jgi:hypothetical protein